MASKGRGGGRQGGTQAGQPSQIDQLTLEARPSDPTQAEVFARDKVAVNNSSMLTTILNYACAFLWFMHHIYTKLC